MSYRKKAERWCLGVKVPVKVYMNDGSIWEQKYGQQDEIPTVSALDPKKKKGPFQQKRGLFIDGPRVDNPNIKTDTSMILG